MSERRYRVGPCGSGQSRWRRPPAVAWSGPTSSSTASRSTPARCGRASCSSRSSPSVTATSSSPLRSAAGAGAYLTSRPAGGGTAIEVADTLRALMDLARVLRAERFAGPRGRDHRQRRQDEHQGPAGRRGRREPRACTPTSAASTTTRACRSTSWPRRTTPRCWSSRWACAASARSPGCARIAAPTIGVVTRVADAHTERGRRDRRRRPGQGRAGRGAARRSARRSSTPTTRGWRRWRRARGAAVLTYGRRPGRRAGRPASSLDELARPSFTARHAVGRGRRAPRRQRARTWSPTPLAALAVAGAVGVRPRRRRRRRWPTPGCRRCAWSSSPPPSGGA